MATYSLYTGSGPALVSYSGPFQSGIAFEVTEGGCWFTGYNWWVPSGGDTGAQKFALWNITVAAATGNYLVPGSVVTSGTLTANAWNFIPLATPVPLSIGAAYIACTGWTAVNGFPDTNNQFGSGDPFAAGITNGPLHAYSDGTNGGTAPNVPVVGPQGQFSDNTGATDPSVYMPTGSSSSANFGIDVVVSDTAPSGYSGSFRIWPNFAGVGPQNGNFVDLNDAYSLGTEFSLSQPCTLNNIWFYSPATSTQLPTQCAIWNVTTQSVVSGTLNTSPSWSGAAGSGWVACAYSGVTLPAGDYKTAVWNASASGTGTGWNEYTIGYFVSGGAGANGIANGPITVPNAATATSPGQSTYATSSSTFLYPNTYVATEGQSYWVDVEVTPVPPAPVYPSVPVLSPPGRRSPQAFRFRTPPPQPLPPPLITVDPSTPAAATLADGANTAITSPAFSPPAGSLIVVLYNQEYTGSGNTQPALTPSESTDTLTWQNGPAQWQASLNGYSAAWCAYVPSAKTGMTVTVTPSASYSGGAQLQVLVLDGAASLQNSTGTATWSGSSSTAEDASVTTTMYGSRVVAAAIGISTGTWTPAGGMFTYGSVYTDSTAGNSCVVGLSSQVSTPGAVTTGWTISPACLVNGIAWEILPPGTGTASGAAALSGSGSLSASGAFTANASAALSGSGSLAASGALAGSASLSGSGTLTGTGAVSYPGQAALSGTGSLTATGVIAGAANLSGSGSLTAAGAARYAGTAALAGSGTLSAAGALAGGAVLSGTGTLSAAGLTAYAGTVLLAGNGTLSASAAGGSTVAGAATFSGTGALAGAWQFEGAAALAGTGSLSASGSVSSPGSAALSGSGTLTATALVTVPGAAALAGSGILAAAGSVIAPSSGTAALSGTGVITATARLAVAGSAQLAGTGTLAVLGGGRLDEQLLTAVITADTPYAGAIQAVTPYSGAISQAASYGGSIE